MGHRAESGSGQRGRSDAELHRQQQQQRAVLRAAGGQRHRHPDLHACRQRDRVSDGDRADSRQRRRTQRRYRHQRTADLRDLRHRGQRRAGLHEGRESDRERRCRRAVHPRMGHRDQCGPGQRGWPGSQLHRQQRQQRAVLRTAGDRRQRDVDLHTCGRSHWLRHGDRAGSRQRWRRQQRRRYQRCADVYHRGHGGQRRAELHEGRGSERARRRRRPVRPRMGHRARVRVRPTRSVRR